MKHAKHRNTNTVWSHLYGKSKEVKLIQPESQMLAVRSKGVGEIDVVQSVQSFNYKVTVFLGFNVQHGDYN